MKVWPERIEELAADEIPDGKNRMILRPIPLQTIEGKKIFSQFPKMVGPTESDLDFVSKEFIDSQLAGIATTKSYTFSLTADHLSQGAASLPIRINPSALDVVRFKVEGSGRFVTVGDDTTITVLTSDNCILNWSGCVAMNRAIVGDKVTIIYQGFVANEAVISEVYTHFTEYNVVDDPFEFWEDEGSES